MQKITLSILMLSLLGCASGHCDRNGLSSLENKRKKVLVYKYDGSKQCQKKIGVSLDEMAKDLTNIKIYSMSKKNDGQMRAQVCGALTGLANVYEIKGGKFLLAEALGFKKWDF